MPEQSRISTSVFGGQDQGGYSILCLGRASALTATESLLVKKCWHPVTRISQRLEKFFSFHGNHTRLPLGHSLCHINTHERPKQLDAYGAAHAHKPCPSSLVRDCEQESSRPGRVTFPTVPTRTIKKPTVPDGRVWGLRSRCQIKDCSIRQE